MTKNREKNNDKRIVAIGGGTGLSNLLRVLKGLRYSPCAVVAMTDNGGSSGRLREDFGMLPPGDVRNCLLALSCCEPDMERLLNYRFPEESSLCGHNLGNLLLAAIMQAEGLDFGAATAKLSDILAIQGQVLPVTLADVSLGAVMADGAVLQGECEIAADRREIREVFLQSSSPCRAREEVLQAISEAEQIFIGPGSLYSSLITNLLVPGIAQALKESPAEVWFIGNMATEPSELATAELSHCLAALEYHYRRVSGDRGRLVDRVIANIGEYSRAGLARLAEGGSQPLVCDRAKLAAWGVEVIAGDFVDNLNVWQHDKEKLAAVLEAEAH